MASAPKDAYFPRLEQDRSISSAKNKFPSPFTLMMKPDACFEIEAKIKHLVRSALKVNPAMINASHSGTPLLGRGIGLDSIETMSLILAIEEEFEISIDDSDLTAHLFESVGDFVQIRSAKSCRDPLDLLITNGAQARVEK